MKKQLRVKGHRMQAETGSERTVLILGGAQETQAIGQIIEKGPYRAGICPSVMELEAMLSSGPCLVVILDIDSVPLDNLTIRDLTLAFPSTYFLCTSQARFHPELKEAISNHLFACLHKPVDPDELHYFLKCIRNDGAESRGSPGKRD